MSAVSGSAKPGPASSTVRPHAPVVALHPYGEGGALRGVPEDVADQRVDDGREIVLREAGPAYAAGVKEGTHSRSCCAASTDQKSSRIATTSAISDDLENTVAARLARGKRGPGRRDDRVELGLELFDGRGDPSWLPVSP